jgi:tetratricopeptide (TPR) repeat protein
MRFNRPKITGHLLLIGFLWLFVGVDFGAAQTRPNRPVKTGASEKLLAEAAAALSREDVSGADAIVQKVLAAAPNNPTAQTLAGIVAEKQNDLPRAEKYFARAARLSPASAETRNNYGVILLKQNKKTEAAREFSASLKINPAQKSALLNLAQIRFAENNFSAAGELFEKALAIAPETEIARALVVIALHAKDAARAAEKYRQYAELVKENAPNPSARAELGAGLLESGLTAEAVTELEAALAADDGNVEVLTALGQAYLKQKNIKQAGRLLESAVARGLDDARIYAALTDVYEAGGYLENAIPAMRRAIEKEPRNEFYRVRYGLLLIDSKAPAAAVIRLGEAARDFPNSAKILLALGIAEQADGKPVDAQNSFEKALKIEPNSVPILAYLALIMDEKGQFDETVSVTERALAVEETNPVLHYLLADTLLKMPDGDPAQAEKHFRRAIQLDSNLTQAHLSLGRLLARQNRWAEAVAEFETSVRLAPDLAEAQYQLGRALARVKRAEDSNKAFEKFKKLNETQTAERETTRKELVQRLANTRF